MCTENHINHVWKLEDMVIILWHRIVECQQM